MPGQRSTGTSQKWSGYLTFFGTETKSVVSKNCIWESESTGMLVAWLLILLIEVKLIWLGGISSKTKTKILEERRIWNGFLWVTTYVWNPRLNDEIKVANKNKNISDHANSIKGLPNNCTKFLYFKVAFLDFLRRLEKLNELIEYSFQITTF